MFPPYPPHPRTTFSLIVIFFSFRIPCLQGKALPAWWPGTLQCSHSTSSSRTRDPPLHGTNYMWCRFWLRRDGGGQRAPWPSTVQRATIIVVQITISPESSKWRYLRRNPAVASFLVTKVFQIKERKQLGQMATLWILEHYNSVKSVGQWYSTLSQKHVYIELKTFFGGAGWRRNVKGLKHVSVAEKARMLGCFCCFSVLCTCSRLGHTGSLRCCAV